MSTGFDLDAGSSPSFGDFFCNDDYAVATTNSDRDIAPLKYYVYVWSVVTGNDLRTLEISGDNGLGPYCYITDEAELIVRDGGNSFGTNPTHMRIYDAADLSLLQSITIAPYLTNTDFNTGFNISEIAVAGDKYLFVQVGPFVANRGPYLILKRIAGVWSVFASHNSDGTTIAQFSNLSAGTQYAYLRNATNIGRVEWFGGYSEALIVPPSLGARSILYVSYIAATDEVLVITGGVGDPTVDALVYNPDLSTLLRSATVFAGSSTALRNIDDRLLITSTVAAVPIRTVGTSHISKFVLFDTVSMTVTRTVTVDPGGDFVNQTFAYNYAVVNADPVGVGVMPVGNPQHLSFWPLPIDITAILDLTEEMGIDLTSMVGTAPIEGLCPIPGVSSDQCIIGQTSIPPGTGQILCGAEQAVARDCD